MKYRHVVSNKIIDVLEAFEHIYKDSPSWVKYEPKNVDTILTDKQLKEVAFKQGVEVNTTKEQLVKSLTVEDTTTTQDFNDNII